MSRVDEYVRRVHAMAARLEPDVVELLTAVGVAWLAAEEGIPSEVEANRWSRVCSAAETVVGL